MKATWLGMAAAAALMVSGYASADQALATKSGCMACHDVAVKKIGPAYKDVAAKYKSDKGAEARLADHIVKGTGPAGMGWMKDGKATMPFMPANTAVNAADAAKLAKWVLSQK